MGTVTLGGRTFEVVPLRFKHLRKILPRIDLGMLTAPLGAGVPGWVIDLAPEIIAGGLAEVQANGAPPITAAWVDELEAGEGQTIIATALDIVKVTGLAAPKGEAASPGEA